MSSGVQYNQLFYSYQVLGNASEAAFRNWFEATKENEKTWALGLACEDGNHKLVAYIVNKSADKVNAIYKENPIVCTALKIGRSWYGQKPKTWDQAKACTQILIKAGADINVRVENDAYSLFGRVMYSLTNLELVRQKVLNEEVTRHYDIYINQKRSEAVFFATNGAKCYIASLGGDMEEEKGLVVEGPDCERKKYLLTILRDVSTQAQPKILHNSWSKMRLIYLGQKGTTSVLSSLPIEVVQLISQKFLELPSLNSTTLSEMKPTKKSFTDTCSLS